MREISTESLIKWYECNGRDLPWRRTKDPYKIWLSEIILQQTRVEQGLPYYEKFVENFPVVGDLARVNLDKVYKFWEGLGYYSRANNLHSTANYIAKELKGTFPNNYKDLIKLKGVGDYTASAISSFCFNEIQPVLDGNVYRVISRFYGIEEEINTPKAKKIFKTILFEIIDDKRPDLFNQAIMEFGALQCVPRNPLCEECIFKSECYAHTTNSVNNFPVKKQTKKSIDRYFNYLVFNKNGQLAIRKRGNKDIWKNLHEFPLLDSKDIFEQESHANFTFYEVSKTYKQVLSHQNIYAKFFTVNHLNGEEFFFIDKKEVDSYGFHGLMVKYLKDIGWI